MQATTEIPLQTFAIELERRKNSRETCKIKKLPNAVVRFEQRHKKTKIPQCARRQAHRPHAVNVLQKIPRLPEVLVATANRSMHGSSKRQCSQMLCLPNLCNHKGRIICIQPDERLSLTHPTSRPIIQTNNGHGTTKRKKKSAGKNEKRRQTQRNTVRTMSIERVVRFQPPHIKNTSRFDHPNLSACALFSDASKIHRPKREHPPNSAGLYNGMSFGGSF